MPAIEAQTPAAEEEQLDQLFQPEVIVVPGYSFDAAAADNVVTLLRAKPAASLIVLTGSTPEAMYSLLQEASRAGVATLRQATLFNLDEYVIDPAHPGSYAAFMESRLFSNLHTLRPRWYIPRGDAADPEAEAAAFEALIRAHVAQNGLIDLAIVGVGPSGAENVHIGFNEPGPDSHRHSVTRVITIPPETVAVNRQLFSDAAKRHGWQGQDEYPSEAMSMGISTILDTSARLLVLAKGAGKARGVKRMLEGPVGWECPASYIRCHPNVTVLLDEAAAVLLQK